MGRRTHAKRAGKVVLSLYREMQPQVDRQVDKYGPASCTKGCNACCRLLTLTDLPQMVPVVEYLTRRPDWNERKGPLAAEIVNHLRAVAETGLPDGDPDERATAAYWDLRIPCVFLEGGLCSVYTQRPGVCRYYVAVTPASDCDGPAGTPVASVDLSPASDRVALAGVEVMGGEALIGTIPAMFVMACRALGVPFDVPDELVRAGVLLHAMVSC